MSNIHIFDSGGSIRHPQGSNDLPDDKREEIRDLFFNSVYAMSDAETINMYFKASTGTPEQFIGGVPDPGGADPIGAARDQLTSVVESELGWSIADAEASEGQQVFSQLLSSDPEAIERYQIETIRDATQHSTIDFGTPDIGTAVGALKWLVSEGPQEWSVAIAGDGRTSFLSDIDIVIEPGAVESGVIGINGSDELLQDRFIDIMAGDVLDIIQQAVPDPEMSSYQARQKQTLGLSEWLLSELHLTSYSSISESELQAQQQRQMKVGAIVGGVVGFLIAFVGGGGLTNLSQWWSETILAGEGTQFWTVATVNSLAGTSLGPLPSPMIIFVTLIAVLFWVAVGGFLWSQSQSEQPNLEPLDEAATGPTGRTASQLEAIIEEVSKTQWADPTALGAALAQRSVSLPADIIVRSNSVIKRKRLLVVGGVGLAIGLAGGSIGWAVGGYTLQMLQYWATIAETVILASLFGVLALLVVYLFAEVLK